jgi:rare lipoprotein A
VPHRTERSQQGLASVYHHRFDGRKMADGGRFSVSSDSAASRTFPLGTVVRVTNVNNGRSQTLRIRDRGPRSGARILDLSPKSARQLGMKKPGLLRVVVTPLFVPHRS